VVVSKHSKQVLAQAQIEPIEDNKKTIAGLVLERIRDAILSGMLPAGSRIDQGKLASDLNVSIVPVREALKKLEAEGFVQIIPRRGAFVTQTSISDLEDLYFARAAIEGQAAYHGAEKLKASDIAELERLMSAMGTALDRHDLAAFTIANRRFHFLIYEAAGSRYMLNMIASLWELAERYRFRYVFLLNAGPVIQSEHQTILDACRKRDKSALRDAIINHMHQTMLGVRTYLLSQREN
jgi:DNA-binding GntR family transcriptional regulator